MAQYERRFLELLPYVEYMKDEKLRTHRFIKGLNIPLQDYVRLAFPATFREVVDKALVAEDIHTRGPNQFQHRQNSGQFLGQQRPPWKGNKN